jgi:hypothetical protein
MQSELKVESEVPEASPTGSPIQAKTPNDVMDMLTKLQAKYKNGGDKLPLEEKKKHHELLQNVLKMVGQIETDLKKSMDTSDHEGMVLQFRGHFPRDTKGSLIIPSKDKVQLAFVTTSAGRYNYSQVLRQADVESVFKEHNFHHIQEGPKSPNFLLRDTDVFVKFASVEQASFVLGMSGSRTVDFGALGGYGFQFVLPSKNSKTRAAYSKIGTLITRLKEVDGQLKALGAVPGRGGVPELSDMLVQKEEFDVAVTAYDKVTLHSFLCTRTRVDKRKRQTALEPLVDERIEILMQLAKIDQEQFPFTFEREFK